METLFVILGLIALLVFVAGLIMLIFKKPRRRGLRLREKWTQATDALRLIRAWPTNSSLFVKGSSMNALVLLR
ncbi:hypothetical protein CCR78_03905 [Rhodovulum imhoffii]|nr:hypothetical protein [Rhodovulum imhoffii]